MRYLLMLSFVIPLLAACAFFQPAQKPREAPRAPRDVTVAGAAVGGLERPQLEAVLAAMAPAKYSLPRSARFDDSGEITPGATGRMLDVAATAAAVLAASPGSAVSPVYRELAPQITAEQLRQAAKAGACRTAIIDGGPGRLHNIILTAKLLNNTLLEPGEEFSFNRRTGEPTAERGFRPAPVIAGGRMEEELGGGMCQVSSTLYNCVLEAGLEVTERHPHSRPVAYVPPGRDAATYTDKDFRFVNTSRKPLLIRTFVSGKNVVADLWTLPP